MVLRVNFVHDIGSHFVENREHMSWFFCKPNCESRLLAGQVSESNFKGLLISLTHGLDAIFVNILASCWVPELFDEGLELPADEEDDFLLLDPLGEWSF